MQKSLFLRIVKGVEAHDDYFKLRRDCCDQLSFSSKQKSTVALRMLALGTTADVVGEMVKMGEHVPEDYCQICRRRGCSVWTGVSQRTKCAGHGEVVGC